MKCYAMIALGAGILLALTSVVQAQDAADVVTIEGARIRGDQEMPTVMYLVPWQPPEVGELRGPEERPMVDQGLSPLERYEFQRFIQYHEAFLKQTEAATGG